MVILAWIILIAIFGRFVYIVGREEGGIKILLLACVLTALIYWSVYVITGG